ELLRSQGPPADLIILDLVMPVMNGWQFLAERNQDPGLAAIPVIVISATLDATADLPNVAGYCKKPIDPELLVRLVTRICSGESGEETTPTRKTPPRWEPSIDPDRLRVLLIQESD